jgi:hypothetical protein
MLHRGRSIAPVGRLLMWRPNGAIIPVPGNDRKLCQGVSDQQAGLRHHDPVEAPAK